MKLVFSSFPEFSDNSLMVLQAVLNNRVDAKCIWLLNDMSNIKNVAEKAERYLGTNVNQIVFVKKNSLKGIYHYLTANFIFETHGMFEQFPILPWQKKINLWHGMPLKKIGRLSGNPIKLKMTATISTAPVFDDIMSGAFEIDKRRVIKVGQPRNDLFFANSKMDFSSLFHNHDATIAWLPTYRQSDVGDIRVDGVQKANDVGGLSETELTQIDQFLEQQEINLVVKLHPMDILNDKLTEFPHFKRIKLLTKNQFASLNLEVNDFLAATAGLITDYSSVYFDYVLTGKPIGILQLDKSAYADGRGFVSREVARQFTGESITNVNDFLTFIKKLNFTNINQKELLDKKIYFDEYDQMGHNSIYLLKLLKLID